MLPSCARACVGCRVLGNQILAFGDVIMDDVDYYTVEYQSSSSRGDKHFISKVTIVGKKVRASTATRLRPSQRLALRAPFAPRPYAPFPPTRALAAGAPAAYISSSFSSSRALALPPTPVPGSLDRTHSRRQLYVLTALAKKDKFEEEEEALRAAVASFAVTPPE